MSDVLDIGRLTTRIRGDDEARAQQLAMQMGELAGRRLPRALDGAGERAIVRAGLPAGAVVAVQRLDLRLRLAANVSPGDLAAGWAAAFEASLAALLARLPPGDADDDAPAVWFADAWAAETRHLVRRASGMADAWWAPDLAGGDDDAPDPVATAAILQRWLRRDPPRAIATMARLARSQGQFALLLTPAEAAGLTAQLARLAGRQASPTPPAPAAAASPAGPVSDHPAPPAAPGHASADRLSLRGDGRNAPWQLALLLAERPSASQLTAEHLRRALASHGVRPEPATPPARSTRTAPPPAAVPDAITASPLAGSPQAAPDDAPTQAADVLTGGLLMLLRPLARLQQLPDAATLGGALGDLALTALRRVLAPLPPGDRIAAQERERPLLAVFAPECDWRERIADVPITNPQAAAERLDALIDAIPADIDFAPGAVRRLFGTPQPAYADAATLRLARLLLRPGVLHVRDWEAELAWPLASVDLALRRAGWDQDPGWQAWLGRRIRFRFGEAA